MQKTFNRESNGKGKARAVDSDDDEGEVIKSEKSLMKHALMMRGSRDTSAQLFTALCRALGIPTRLVVSLQSVPWQAGIGKPKPQLKKTKVGGKDVGASASVSKGKQKATQDGEDEDDMEMEEVEIPGTPAGKGRSREGSAFLGPGQRLDGGSAAPVNGDVKGKQKAPPVIKLRNSRGRKLGSEPAIARPPPRTSSLPYIHASIGSNVPVNAVQESARLTRQTRHRYSGQRCSPVQTHDGSPSTLSDAS